MNRLNTRHWLYLLSFIMGIVLLQGCGYGGSAQYRFIEVVQVVEVDADRKSFRIEVECVEDYNSYDYAKVFLDTINTTARHNVHFINHVDELRRIGVFTPMDSDDMFYRDVELLPENITNEVSIFYYIGNGSSVKVELNDRLEVILRPKTNND